MDTVGLRTSEEALNKKGEDKTKKENTDEELIPLKVTIKVQQYCPLCKVFVNDKKFKIHMMRHWVPSKKDEEFDMFIRRVYNCQVVIDFILLNNEN